MAERYIQILTTFNKKERAQKLARTLIEQRLSGCVQIIGPVESIYRWKNKIEKSKEWLCLIKTKGSFYDKIEKIIKEINQYEIPEIIAFSLAKGSKEYIKWLSDELKK